MICQKCEKSKPTQQVVGRGKISGYPINWCENCIEESEAVELRQIKEEGKFMVISTDDVEGYGDYKVEYIELRDQLGKDQSIMEEVYIIDREKLEKQINE